MTGVPAADRDAAHWDDADAAAARERIGSVAEALPGVTRADEHGHSGWLVRGRRFAWLLVDHHGDGRLALCVKAPPGEQEALVAAEPERCFVPAYLGHRGWVGLRVDPGASPDWAELTELVEQAWRLSAGPRAVAARARGEPTPRTPPTGALAAPP